MKITLYYHESPFSIFNHRFTSNWIHKVFKEKLVVGPETKHVVNHLNQLLLSISGTKKSVIEVHFGVTQNQYKHFIRY